MIDAEGSELLAEVFNRMTKSQKNSVPEDVAERIGRFMMKNGYRLVFTRWYMQVPPGDTINYTIDGVPYSGKVTHNTDGSINITTIDSVPYSGTVTHTDH